MAGIGADDVDVAELYDHFTQQVIAVIEDYGFCGTGEGGPFVRCAPRTGILPTSSMILHN